MNDPSHNGQSEPDGVPQDSYAVRAGAHRRRMHAGLLVDHNAVEGAKHSIGPLDSPHKQTTPASSQESSYSCAHRRKNTTVYTEHGPFSVGELQDLLSKARDTQEGDSVASAHEEHHHAHESATRCADTGVYGTRETLAYDRHGFPVIIREQQHLLEVVPLNKCLKPYLGKWIMLVVQLVWAFIQWSGVVLTIYMSGFDSYTHYFTNWMWTIGTVYNTVDLLTFLDATGHLQFLWIAAVFWPVFANVAQVFWLVFIMICDNPDLFKDLTSEYGFCPVLLVDRVKHVVPFFLFILYAILRHKDINLVLYTIAVRGWRSILLYVLIQFAFAHFILFGYWSNFDFYAIYGLSINVWIGFIAVEALYLAWLMLPIILHVPLVKHYWVRCADTRRRELLRFERDMFSDASEDTALTSPRGGVESALDPQLAREYQERVARETVDFWDALDPRPYLQNLL